MGRPAVELSLAPPRAAEREDFFGKFQGRGFDSGDLHKKWPDRDSDPRLRTTGPKNLPLGQKIAVLKMANKTLRSWRKKRARAACRGRDHEAKNRQPSKTKGAFVHSPIREWPSGERVPSPSQGRRFNSHQVQKIQGQKQCPHQQKSSSR